MTNKFAGKVAVITGGSTGMGLATAKRFVEEGMEHVFITGRRKDALEEVRARLTEMDGPLSDFHCTLAACVLAEHRGFVCQVGDSIVLSTTFLKTEGDRGTQWDFFPDQGTRLFIPDRGEYVNETHFITEPDWLKHLRVSTIDADGVDALFLMTDGAMDVAMVKGKVFRGFLSNLIGKLLTLPSASASSAR